MTWFGWLLIVLWVMNALVTIGKVGKGRKPVTTDDAIVAVAWAALLTLGLVMVGA